MSDWSDTYETITTNPPSASKDWSDSYETVPGITAGKVSPFRITIAPPKVTAPIVTGPAEIEPGPITGERPVLSSVPAAFRDVPHEIAGAFTSGYEKLKANQPFAQDVSNPSLTAPLSAATGVAEMAASPITGAARSLIGHPIADVVQALGGRLDRNVVGPQESPEQAYEEGKNAADTIMLLSGASGRTPGAALPQLSGPAATAERLGAPLPRGVASESRAVNAVTSGSASIPLFGARIHNALDATREAAGDAIAQSNIDRTITANRQAIDNLYTATRNSIDPDKVMPMPQTASAVAAIKARRAAARQSNPSAGLEQFENVGSQGVSFNGAQRAREDARNSGDVANPHPGIGPSDYNQITRAMTGDMRVNIFRQGGQQALDNFEKAEKQFVPISKANQFLKKLQNKGGTGAGLDEIGFNPMTGKFSLDKFVTEWNKINPQARPFVPEPAHRKNINDIFEMGGKIKSSMRERNTSHTATPIIMWDLARDAIMTGAAVGAGVVSGASVVGSAIAATPAIVLMHWLSSPSKAASMANWARIYRAAAGSPMNSSRIAQFNIATRNLANNLGVNVGSIMQSVQRYLPVPAQEQQQQQPGTK